MIEICKNKMMGCLDTCTKKVSEKALLFGLKHNQEYFNAKVLEVSKKVARNFIDNELKKQGLIHCQFCNSRSQLKNINGTYICKQCSDKIKGGKTNG